jgi:hypothetical protein
MRRWFITAALLANAVISGLVLLLLLNDGGWGEATRLSATEVDALVLVAATALVLDLLLIPVLGISFWARDRGFRRQAAQIEAQRGEPPASPRSPDDHGQP